MKRRTAAPLTQLSMSTYEEQAAVLSRLEEQKRIIRDSLLELDLRVVRETELHKKRLSDTQSEEHGLLHRKNELNSLLESRDRQSREESNDAAERVTSFRRQVLSLEQELKDLEESEKELEALYGEMSRRVSLAAVRRNVFAEEFEKSVQRLEDDRYAVDTAAAHANYLKSGGSLGGATSGYVPPAPLSRTLASYIHRDNSGSATDQIRRAGAAVSGLGTRRAPLDLDTLIEQDDYTTSRQQAAVTRSHNNTTVRFPSPIRHSPKANTSSYPAPVEQDEREALRHARASSPTRMSHEPEIGNNVYAPILNPSAFVDRVRGSPNHSQRILANLGGVSTASTFAGSAETSYLSPSKRNGGTGAISYALGGVRSPNANASLVSRPTSPSGATVALMTDTVSELHRACGETPMSVDRVVSIIKAVPASVNMLDELGNTALHIACGSAAPSLDVVHALLLAGCSPRVKNARGLTAFHVACLNLADTQHKLKRFLIFKGAQSVNQRTASGETAAHLLAINDRYLPALQFLGSVQADFTATALLRANDGASQQKMTPLDKARLFGAASMQCQRYLEGASQG